MERVDAAPAPPVNVLLVDDNPRNLLALDTVVRATDRRLVHAASGAAALKALLRDEFAVVLMDVQMPGMDGFETAALMRERERTRGTPIIFLTAASRSEAFVARGYAVGAVDYLVKPYDPEMLRQKVAVFVDLFRKTEQVQRQARIHAELLEERLARAEAERERVRLDAALLVVRTVAHDLNNALSPIVGGAELLRLDPGVSGHPSRSAYLAMIEHAAQDAAAKVGRLQAIVRLEEQPSVMGSERPVLDMDRSTVTSRATGADRTDRESHGCLSAVGLSAHALIPDDSVSPPPAPS